MRVLLVQNMLYVPIRGGANKANRTLMEGLAKKKHCCRAVVPATAGHNAGGRAGFLGELTARKIPFEIFSDYIAFKCNEVEVHAVTEKSRLHSHAAGQIRKFRPDITLVSSQDPGQILLETAVGQDNVRVVYIVHSPWDLPFGLGHASDNTSQPELMCRTAGIITVSKDLQERIRRGCGCESTVIPFPVYGCGPFQPVECFDNGFATIVNPCSYKGISIFSSLARRMPGIQFSAVPTWGTTSVDRDTLKQLTNVHIIEPVDNIDEILRQTRILLMPSLWPEGYGLIVVEAMLRGIPVLASDTGGLPEAMLGVDYVLPVQPITEYLESLDEMKLPIPVIPPQDLDPWEGALGRLASDREHWQQLSARSRNAALEFVSHLGITPFEDFFNEIVRTPKANMRNASSDRKNLTCENQDVLKLIESLSPERRSLLMLKMMKTHKLTSKKESIPRLPRNDGSNRFPLSFAQRRLWLVDQLEPGNPAYNIWEAFRLVGKLDVPALDQSLNEVVRRHEILRTFFRVEDGEPVQVVAPELNLSMSVIDLTEIVETKLSAKVRTVLTRQAKRVFDLTEGPLLRAMLLKIGCEEHILYITMHHIISDGWSAAVLCRELGLIYNAISNNRPCPLAPLLHIQYGDYAVWQRQKFTGAALETKLNYWRKQFGGEPSPALRLPTDHPRPPIQTYDGAVEYLQLSKKLSNQINALARREQVTLFITLLAAFKTLLHRLSGQDDIIVGSPVANRDHSEMEGLIGFFVNTLVLRTDMSGALTFRQLLNRVRKVALEAYAHQDLPFERLVEELQPKRDMSRSPLFQVFFNMLNFKREQLKLQGLEVRKFVFPEIHSRFDLNFYASEQNGHIKLRLVYNTDLFNRDRIVEMLSQFSHLMTQIVDRPDERIAKYSLVSPQSEFLLPDACMPLRCDWEGSIHGQISQQAEKVPERAAIVYSDEVWSYSRLDSFSSQMANYLLAEGVRSQNIVAIYGDRSSSLVLAILAVVKAGAAFAILDPSFPATRLVSQMQLIRPRAWIQICDTDMLSSSLKEFVETIPCRLRLSKGTSLLEDKLFLNYSTDAPNITVGPDNLAYIAFTSGSISGTIKAIRGTHRPLSHFFKWQVETFKLNESDRFSMVSGLGHDPLLRDVFTPLRLGATLCIPMQKDMETPSRLMDWVRREEITVVHLTPGIGRLLMDCRDVGTADDERIESLRYLFYGGDVLKRRDVIKIMNLAPNATCINFYGATETPQAMGYFVVPPLQDKIRAGQPAQVKEEIPVGKGIEGVQLLVLNATRRLTGIGEIGEIHVRTPYLSEGYVDDEELTAEKYISNPFSDNPEDRLYRSGDLGRYLPDGNVEFLGRIDRQVKIRGFRVELEEIESNLAGCSGTRQCAVTTSGNEHEDRELIAYIVCEEENSSLSLRRQLKEFLPSYMIPSRFVQLDAIPLTPNGKVDYRRLPLLVPERSVQVQGHIQPRTLTERKIAEIWRNVIGADEVELNDNFFDLGGHSLMVVKTIGLIEKEIGIRVPFREFLNQTLRQFAASCEERLSSNEYDYANKQH